MDDQRPARKRRLRFSIRDLLLITIIAAVSIGWFLDHRVLALNAAKTDQAIKTIDVWRDRCNKIYASNQYIDKQLQRAQQALLRLRDYNPRLVDAALEVAHDINSFRPLPEDYPHWQKGHDQNYGPYGFQEFPNSP